MSDLARRLVACKHFQWMPGMLARTERGDGTWRKNRIPEQFCVPCDARPWLPDLDDPATVGCVLALVRAALGHNGTSVLVEVRWSPTAPGWRIVRWDRAGSIAIGLDDHPTEAAALVAALEAAP